jgi:hypothetical protein
MNNEFAENISVNYVPVETISAWAVGLRFALAHGSILTLANYNQTEKIRLQLIKNKFWLLNEEKKV